MRVAGRAAPSAEKSLILATTTSTQDSGLLDELLPAFTDGHRLAGQDRSPSAAVRPSSSGRRGEADVLLVHSPAAEQEFVAEGTAGQRRLVMHNDFVLVGPASGPGRDRAEPTSAQAMQKIAAAQSVFVSRGDDSGTNAQEKDLWDKAGGHAGRGLVPVHRAGHGRDAAGGQREGAATRCPTGPPTSPSARRSARGAQRGRPGPAQRLPRDRDDDEGR